ncbi:FMRFamide receptor-like [Folsomia candida]|uniref:FMRFamide receptor-like n=1 Tax=Folsomia candida TaxID=158441 RepID=UPI001604B597|nr:FMRFamide receptor-like [Folsomia candida]
MSTTPVVVASTSLHLISSPNYLFVPENNSTNTSTTTFSSLLVSLVSGENETTVPNSATDSSTEGVISLQENYTSTISHSQLENGLGLQIRGLFQQNLTSECHTTSTLLTTMGAGSGQNGPETSFLLTNDTFDEAMVKNSVEFLPLGLALWIVCLFGLVGNLLSAMVLRRPKMKSTYSILTLGLTFCDMVYLLMKLLRYGLLSLFAYYGMTNSYTEVIYPICGPCIRALTFTSQCGSTYFTVALSIDRYISVCWPVKARFLCTKRRAYLLGGLVMVFSILYNATRWLEFYTEVSTVFNETLNANVTTYTMEISALRRKPLYKSLYIFWGYFLVIFFIPFTSLSFFNYKIFKEVRRSNKARRKLTSFQKREISFAMMLVSIVALFLICSLDYLVIDLLTYFNQAYPPFWDQLGNFLLTVNSAGNFIIYCAFGRKFRQEFVAMMRQVVLCRREARPQRVEFGSMRIIPDLISGNEAGMRPEGEVGIALARNTNKYSSVRSECHCQRTVYL